VQPGADELLVAQLVPYGDSDVVVRFLSRQRGRGAAFARGARRSKKRFAGSLQVLARGTATLRERRGADMPALESFEAEPDLFALAADPDRYGRAAYLVEVTLQLLPEAEPAPEVYDALCAALGLIGAGRGDARLLRAYELKLLAWTGYLPDLTEAGDWLDGPSGELVVDHTPGGVPFGPPARTLARALIAAQLDALPTADDDELRVVGRLFAAHLRRMGVRDLKSVAFLRSIS
jgi:DNA repair protein RecO (recombination protein O)